MRGHDRLWLAWGPRGPLQSSSEAWDAVKHVVLATRQNYLCWRHSTEATFEFQVKNPSHVLANFATSGGVLEAPGTPENGAPVYAPASLRRNSGCRLRGLGACAKSLAKHGLEWRVRSTRSNVSCVGAGFRPSFPAPPLALPSTRFGRFAPNPVCRLRENAIRCSCLRAEGGFEKRRKGLRSGLGFGGPGPSEDGS